MRLASHLQFTKTTHIMAYKQTIIRGLNSGRASLNSQSFKGTEFPRKSSSNCPFVRFYSPLPRPVKTRSPRIARASPLYIQKSKITPEFTSQLLSDNAYRILSEPTLIVQRNIEFMNLFLGFEVANHYNVMNASGQIIGHMQERDVGISKMIMRQVAKLHRPFDIDLLDLEGNVVLNISRRFSFINSHIKVGVPALDNKVHILGETVQQWHLWRRKYNLFEYDESEDAYDQFGVIDSGFLAFDFAVRDENMQIKSMINRTWGGIGREFLTDMASYIIRMDPQLSFNSEGLLFPGDVLSSEQLNLKQRAVMLANAVSIDFDYFSRHSRGGHNNLFFSE